MSDPNDEFDDLDYKPGGGMPPWALPVATAGAAVAVGALMGGMLAWVFKPPVIEEVKVPRDYTQEELESACAPFVLDKTNEIEEVQSRVTTLQEEVSSKDARVKELEQEMASRLERGKDLIRELEQAKMELKEAKAQLAQAQEEKKQLIEELKATVETLERTEEELEEQKERTEVAKEDALVNKYYRFISDAQIEVCDKGWRKKRGRCRETVQANLEQPERRDKFAHCIRSGQAVPSVYELPRKEELPEYAEYLDQEENIVKDWYVLWCDPTLPEKEDGYLSEDHLPPTAADADEFGVKEVEEL